MHIFINGGCGFIGSNLAEYHLGKGDVVPQASSKEPFSIFGHGEQTHSFCYGRDVVVALYVLANQPQSIGQIIKAGNDHEISINDLAQLVCECIGYKNLIRYVPYKEAYGGEFKADLIYLNYIVLSHLNTNGCWSKQFKILYQFIKVQ